MAETAPPGPGIAALLAAAAPHCRVPFGVDTHARAASLLARLHAESPPSPQTVALWLTPLLAGPGDDASAVADAVQRAAEAPMGRAAGPRAALPSPPPLPRTRTDARIVAADGGRRFGLAREVVVILAGLVVLGFVARWIFDLTGTDGTVSVPSAPDNAASAEALLEFMRDIAVVLGGSVQAAPLLSAVVVVASLLEILRRARRQALQRAMGFDDGTAKVRFDRGPWAPWSGTVGRRGVAAIAAFTTGPSHRIDPAATVRATVRAGGVPTLRFSRRPRLPEHDVLADLAAGGAHTVMAADALARGLRMAGAGAVRRVYRDDPSELIANGGGHGGFGGLLARAPGRRALVLSEARRLLGPDGRVRETWVRAAAAYDVVVVMSPESAAERAAAAPALAVAGITVAGRAEDDPTAVAAALAVAEGRAPARPATPGPTPDTAAAAAQRRMEDAVAAPARATEDAPPTEERAALTELLRARLTPGAYELLAALAVYPELRPGLTALIATTAEDVAGAPLVTEARLAELSRLAWLRDGRIPNWARADLLAALDPGREAALRASVYAALLHPQEGGALSLEIARERPATVFRLLEGALPRDAEAQRDAVFMRGFDRADPTAFPVRAALNRALAGLRGAAFFASSAARVALVAALALLLEWLGLFGGAASLLVNGLTALPVPFGAVFGAGAAALAFGHFSARMLTVARVLAAVALILALATAFAGSAQAQQVAQQQEAQTAPPAGAGQAAGPASSGQLRELPEGLVVDFVAPPTASAAEGAALAAFGLLAAAALVRQTRGRAKSSGVARLFVGDRWWLTWIVLLVALSIRAAPRSTPGFGLIETAAYEAAFAAILAGWFRARLEMDWRDAGTVALLWAAGWLAGAGAAAAGAFGPIPASGAPVAAGLALVTGRLWGDGRILSAEAALGLLTATLILIWPILDAFAPEVFIGTVGVFGLTVDFLTSVIASAVIALVVNLVIRNWRKWVEGRPSDGGPTVTELFRQVLRTAGGATGRRWPRLLAAVIFLSLVAVSLVPPIRGSLTSADGNPALAEFVYFSYLWPALRIAFPDQWRPAPREGGWPAYAWSSEGSPWIWAFLPVGWLLSARYATGPFAVELAIWPLVAVWLGARQGRHGHTVLLASLLPAAVAGIWVSGFSFGGQGIGLLAASVLLCRVAGQPALRRDVLAASWLPAGGLVFLAVGLNSSAGYSGEFDGIYVALVTAAEPALFILVLLLGASRVDPVPAARLLLAVWAVSTVAGVVGASYAFPNIAGLSLAPELTSWVLPIGIALFWAAGRVLREVLVRPDACDALTGPVMLLLASVWVAAGLRLSASWTFDAGIVLGLAPNGSGTIYFWALVLLAVGLGLLGGRRGVAAAFVLQTLATCLPLVLSLVFPDGLSPLEMGAHARGLESSSALGATVGWTAPQLFLGPNYAIAPGLSAGVAEIAVPALFGYWLRNGLGERAARAAQGPTIEVDASRVTSASPDILRFEKAGYALQGVRRRLADATARAKEIQQRLEEARATKAPDELPLAALEVEMKAADEEVDAAIAAEHAALKDFDMVELDLHLAHPEWELPGFAERRDTFRGNRAADADALALLDGLVRELALKDLGSEPKGSSTRPMLAESAFLAERAVVAGPLRFDATTDFPPLRIRWAHLLLVPLGWVVLVWAAGVVVATPLLLLFG